MAPKEKKGEKKVITNDPRFSSVHNDPRFIMPRKKALRDTLDDRFKSAIKSSAFQDRTEIDRYGRKIKSDKNKKELEKFYNLDESDDEREQQHSKTVRKKSMKKSKERASKDASESESESQSDSESESESELESESKARPKSIPTSVGESFIDRARGEGGVSSSSSEEESDSDDSSSEEEEEESDEQLVQEVIPTGEETKRFAVVNMDWDNVRAVDLMVSFQSFVPTGGSIKSVSIYVSEYGKEMMAKEALKGPDMGPKSKKELKREKKLKEKEITADDIVKVDDGEEVNSTKLRHYQLQRLRYYYAVVECDNILTARTIYDTCDGTEYESSANFFDLRYIPDDVEFDDKPHDRCVKVPLNYVPNNFVTNALQHSNVKLTWDETPNERLQLTTRNFSNKELEEMDFQAYLASSSDEEDVDKDKYRALFSDILKPTKAKEAQEGSSDSEGDVDMEITFGGEDKGEENKKEEEETTIEKYQRKEKERRDARISKWKESKQNTESTKNSKKQSQNPKRDEPKKAELDLLAMDDDLFTLAAPRVEAPTDPKTGKKLSKKRALEEADAQFDTKDDRFQALFDNPDYAIDTTVPQFKKSKGLEKVMNERRRRTNKKSAR